MAVSAEYLDKVRRAVRRSVNAETDEELTDIIEECRHDLICLGIKPEKTMDEKDPLILGAVRCFARWKFGLDNDEAPLNREDYFVLRDELRKRVEYCTFQTK